MAKWYVESNGLQYGPMTVGELRLLAAAGRLQPSDRVRRHGMARWVRAKAVRGLFLPVAIDVAKTAPDALPAEVETTPDPIVPPAIAQVEPAEGVFDFYGGEVADSGVLPFPAGVPSARPGEGEAGAGTAEVPVLPVLPPVSPGRLVIAELTGRAVDLWPDGSVTVRIGYTKLQLIPGWLIAAAAVTGGPLRETYLRLARLDGAVFTARPAADGVEVRVLSFHVGRQAGAVGVDGDQKAARDFLDAVIAAGGGGRR